MPPQVRPVVRPLLAMRSCGEAGSPFPPVDEMPGGAAASEPSAWRAPNAKMLPVGSTLGEATCAIAASVFVAADLSGIHVVSAPTGRVPGPFPFGVQLLSIKPGCTMASPTAA